MKWVLISQMNRQLLFFATIMAGASICCGGYEAPVELVPAAVGQERLWRGYVDAWGEELHFSPPHFTTGGITSSHEAGWIFGSDGSFVELTKDGWRSVTDRAIVCPMKVRDFWMSEDGSQGWAVGYDGQIFELRSGKWTPVRAAGASPRNSLFVIEMSADGQTGWAAGRRGTVLSYDDGEWESYSNPAITDDMGFFGIWLSEDGSTGWMTGSKGVILKLENGEWEIKRESDPEMKILSHLGCDNEGETCLGLTSYGNVYQFGEAPDGSFEFSEVAKAERARDLWMAADGKRALIATGKTVEEYDVAERTFTESFALHRDEINSSINFMHFSPNGDHGILSAGPESLVEYRNGEWIHNQMLMGLPPQDGFSVWVSEDASEGWALGPGAAIVRFDGKEWTDYKVSRDRRTDILDAWVSRDGTQGWAVGKPNVILRLQDGDWVPHKQSKNISSGFSPKGMWMNEDGDSGWIYGQRGGFLRLEEGQWVRHQQSSPVPAIYIQDLWMNSEDTEGWAVGLKGAIIHFKDGVWKTHTQEKPTTKDSLTDIWFNEDESEGWIYPESDAMLTYENGQWVRAWELK